MEVTRKNFKESLPLIRASISKADFLVIDTEFTGLMNGRDVCMFDTPAEYYTTILNGASDFLVIQYGLCAFYWDATLKRYKNDAYNFYLFPRGRPGPEKLFLCQGSSLDFLASQGFDFNKLIREGISFMSEPVETKLRDVLIEKHKAAQQDYDIIPIPAEYKDCIERACTKVREFLDKNEVNEMEVERCNAFVRRLMYQEIKIRFKNEVYLETVVLENKERILKVFRLTEDHNEMNREKLKKQKEWEDFEDAVGFSKVARMISQSEKLVIGHNMLLDLIHTLNHFFQPLKAMGYTAFKEFTHCMFPKLLDTKYMSSVPPFKDKVNSSVLKHLFLTLSEAPFSIPQVDSDEGRGYGSADDKQHEAGYDAYVTGLCFLAMHSHLRRNERVLTTHPNLLPFLNKLFLARTAPVDSPYINLNGDDPSPPRDHVFHLTFPREWQRNSISDLFRPFGPITVQFLDDTSALVLLSKRENAQYVLRAFDDSNRVKVSTYESYKKLTSWTDERQIEKMELELKRTRAMLQARLQPDNAQKPRQDAGSRLKPPPSPEKVTRGRSNSLTLLASTPTSPPAAARKRTSSGVFKIDEVEPPAKKEKEAAKSTNNNVKVKENKKTEDQIKDKRKEKPVIVSKFDSESQSKCVTAFKESDSWD